MGEMIDGYQRETNVNNRRGRGNRLTNLKIEMPPFFPEMKNVISKQLLEMQQSGVKRVAFYGLGDKMEVAYIKFQGLHMKLVGIVDDEINWGRKLFGYKVITPKKVMRLNPDAILVTSLRERKFHITNLMKLREWDSIRVFTI